VGAFIAEHEVHEVSVAGAFLLSLLTLPTPWFLLVALGVRQQAVASRRDQRHMHCHHNAWHVNGFKEEDKLTRILRSRQLEHPLLGFPQYTIFIRKVKQQTRYEVP
jgi:hypothetical protein